MAKHLCPFCQTQADVIVYGMLSGPPGPGKLAGGCVITPGRDPQFSCPSCGAEWLRDPEGVKVVVSFGTNPGDQSPRGYLAQVTLEAAAPEARTRLQAATATDRDAVLAVLAEVGAEYGLTAKQSRALLSYI